MSCQPETEGKRGPCRRVCFVRHGRYPDDPRSRKEANALVEAGYQVDVICLKDTDQPTRQVIDAVNVYRIPIRHRRAGVARYVWEYALSFVLFSVLLTFLHLRRRYECIHVATMPDFLVFTAVLPRWLGAKVLLDLHEPTPELWQTKFGERLRPLLRFQRRLEQSAIGYADATITVTPELRERVIERGASADKVFVVRNVCDDRMLSAGPAAAMPTERGRFCLITHGSIEERYGHEEMIHAVAALRDRVPGLCLEILGCGEHLPQLVRLAGELGCCDRVEFAGYVPHDELIARLQAADVGVIAMRRSLYSELIDTNKMYEYMALRKPVIISRLRPVANVFDDSCVRFFEPGSTRDLSRCIVELFEDPQRRAELAANAYRRYATMRWEHTKDTYLQVVNGLVGLN